MAAGFYVLQSLQVNCSLIGSTNPSSILSWNSPLVSSTLTEIVSLYWFTIPLYCWTLFPVLRFSHFSKSPMFPKDHSDHLSEFCFPPEYSSVDPSHLAVAIRLLSWTSVPYSTYQIRRSTWATGFHTCLRSVFRVWIPS
jgi:hypothetical protein